MEGIGCRIIKAVLLMLQGVLAASHAPNYLCEAVALKYKLFTIFTTAQ